MKSERIRKLARFGVAVVSALIAALLPSGGAVGAGDHRSDELVVQQDAQAQTQEIAERYTKHEYRIPMRDGAKLFTAVYVPKDASAVKTYPFLIQRTPYSVRPYGPDNYPRRLGPAPSFMKDGFIFVYQDVRGRYQSD